MLSADSAGRIIAGRKWTTVVGTSAFWPSLHAVFRSLKHADDGNLDVSHFALQILRVDDSGRLMLGLSRPRLRVLTDLLALRQRHGRLGVD